MQLASTFEEARILYRGSVGCVPTMGYLHEGHLALIARAREENETVVVTLFVNPFQFGSEEDLGRYPRDFDRDSDLAVRAGTDILFAPSFENMYPDEPLTSVIVRDLAAPLEGVFRPGHFAGVASVVAKLFAGLRPDRAYFGRKDAQQLAIVRRLTADLSFPTEVIGCATIREADGLALSSRNVHLSDEERAKALGMSKGLAAAEGAILEGERRARALERLTRLEAGKHDLHLQYADLVDAESMRRLVALDAESFLGVAALVGKTRLIDNLYVRIGADGAIEPEFGQLLAGPSVIYGGR